MEQAQLNELSHRALMVALELSLPILLATLIVGVLISLFQAVTQIQEMTLTFVPKILVAAVVIVIAGPWMLSQIVGFASGLFTGAPSMIR